MVLNNLTFQLNEPNEIILDSTHNITFLSSYYWTKSKINEPNAR